MKSEDNKANEKLLDILIIVEALQNASEQFVRDVKNITVWFNMAK